MEKAVEILLQYGAIGVILAYFLWKDRETFKLYRTTMQEMVNTLQKMQDEQKEIKGDIEEIKKAMGK